MTLFLTLLQLYLQGVPDRFDLITFFLQNFFTLNKTEGNFNTK